MLLRLIRLTGITRWAATKGANFQRTTLIYAENGRGKTSFTATLRSLLTGDPEALLERATIGSAEPPAAELLVDSGAGATKHTFNGKSWSAPVADIEIFDTRFVSDNVYSGDAVDPDQRRGLHKFVLGAANVQLANAVDQLDAEIRNLGALQKEGEECIATIADDAYSVDEFLRLKVPAGLADMVSAQKGRVTLALQSATVASTPAFVALVLPSLDIQNALKILGESFNTLAAEAEKKVRAHVHAHLDQEGDSWLSAGIEYLGEGAECPFCGQAVGKSALIADYRLVFSQAYTQHRERFEALVEAIETKGSAGSLMKAVGALTSNSATAPFWTQHGVSAPPQGALAALEAVWGSAFDALAGLIARKRLDILSAVDPSNTDSTHLSALQAAMDSGADYNTAVGVANGQIASRKTSAAGTTVAAEEQALRRLLAAEARGEVATVRLCNTVSALRKAKTEKEAAKTTAKTCLETASTKLFEQYEIAINKHLERSGCAYRITGTKTAYAGGKPRTEYQLKLNGKAIDLVQPKNAPLAPYFGNTLSDGDRSTLAFALFLARLDLDPRLSDKIVVIDDPMTSLDAHRRAYTRERIARLAKSARQLVLLSHDALFAREVWDAVPAPKTALSLEASGETTIVSEWDIIASTQSEYFLRCEMLLDCIGGVSTQSRLAVVAVLRPVLEGSLRMRFPRGFPSDKWLGDFIKMIREANAPDPLAKMTSALDEISDINDYSKRYHHDDGPVAGVGQPDLAELQSYCRRTLDLISGVTTI